MGDGGYLLRRLNVKAVRYEDKRIQNPYGLKQTVTQCALQKNKTTLRRTLLKKLLIRFLFYPVLVCTFIHLHLHLHLLLFSFSFFFWSFVSESKKQRWISLYAYQFLKPVKYTPLPRTLKSQKSTKTMDSRPIMQRNLHRKEKPRQNCSIQLPSLNSGFGYLEYCISFSERDTACIKSERYRPFILLISVNENSFDY